MANEPLTPNQRITVVVLFLVLLLAILDLTHVKDQISVHYLQQEIRGHSFEGLLIFILLFSLGNLIHIPGWLFLAAAVITLGKTEGGIVTYIAASISCGITFFMIRYLGKNSLQQVNNKLIVSMIENLHSRPIVIIAVLRLLFQTMPALNYAIAMSGVPFRKYIIGTLLGLPLPIALYCVFFDYLARVLKLV